MQIKKLQANAHADPESFVAEQAQYIAHKYKTLFMDQASQRNRHMYAYPPPKESVQEGELRALEHNMGKDGHGVPLSSEWWRSNPDIYTAGLIAGTQTLRMPSTSPRLLSEHHHRTSRSSSIPDLQICGFLRQSATASLATCTPSSKSICQTSTGVCS